MLEGVGLHVFKRYAEPSWPSPGCNERHWVASGSRSSTLQHVTAQSAIRLAQVTAKKKKALKHLPESLFQRDANSTAKSWWVVQGLNL